MVTVNRTIVGLGRYKTSIAYDYAQGGKLEEIAAKHGMTPDALRQLLVDNSFQSVVLYYRGLRASYLANLFSAEIERNLHALIKIRDGRDSFDGHRIDAIKEMHRTFEALKRDSHLMPRLGALEAKLSDQEGNGEIDELLRESLKKIDDAKLQELNRKITQAGL